MNIDRTPFESLKKTYRDLKQKRDWVNFQVIYRAAYAHIHRHALSKRDISLLPGAIKFFDPDGERIKRRGAGIFPSLDFLFCAAFDFLQIEMRRRP